MEVNKIQIINNNNKLTLWRQSAKVDTPVQFSHNKQEILAPLKQDTVSFKGAVLKKSDFKGTDLAVIERYKPNIQQFKSKEDLQTFAESKINELKDKDFGGRQEETKVQRKAMLKEWFDYVIKENDAYSNTQRLSILAAVVKDLKPNNDTIPPVLRKGVLAQTVTELETRLKDNPKENFDFNKMYQNNLRTEYLEDSSTGETMTGWVVIPSKINDPENFEKNVEKLKTLSHNNWCTKSFNAEPYLSEGDFHVYLENGQPKLGVRFVGGEVQEIQGERNNSKIPQKYLDTFKSHQEECNVQLRYNAINQVQNAEVTKIELEKIKQELGAALKLKTIDDAIKIFDYAGINAEKKDNMLVIPEYRPLKNYQFDYEDLGIDENKLFQFVTAITENADFRNSQITNLGQLQCIGGDAYFGNSQITNLGQLQYIGGKAYFRNSKITNLGQLKTIGKDACFENSKITDLGQLQCIGGDADFRNSQMTNLGQLQYIGENANFEYSQITDIGQLQSIGENAFFGKSQITDLGQLKTIGKDAYLGNSKITNLGQLNSIGGNADFIFSQMTDLGQLKSIGGNATFVYSKITDLGQLQSIGGHAHFEDSKVTNLGQLNSIGGNANFIFSRMTDLGQLQSIGGHAHFEDSKVTNLGQLKNIKYNATIKNSNLKLKDLTHVKVGNKIITDDGIYQPSKNNIWTTISDTLKKIFS